MSAVERLDIEDVKAHSDIVALVGQYTELRRSGAQLTGLCPLHGEKTPSFVVQPEKNVWFCHGCGHGGDALTFLMLLNHLSFPDALAALAAFSGASPAPVYRPPPLRTEPQPTLNAAALWESLSASDDAGESYLAGRGLNYRDEDVLRFSVGVSGCSWLDARAREGYRVAFAVRNPDGDVQTVSLRYALPGDPPQGKKTMALPGCSTKGAAICSPAIGGLMLDDDDLAASRLLFVEGGTSWLGASALFESATGKYGSAPTWPLAVIGVAQVAGVVAAFAAAVRKRLVLVGLDADDAGRAASKDAMEAATAAGARRVPLRAEPPQKAKDWADAARREFGRG